MQHPCVVAFTDSFERRKRLPPLHFLVEYARQNCLSEEIRLTD